MNIDVITEYLISLVPAVSAMATIIITGISVVKACRKESTITNQRIRALEKSNELLIADNARLRNEILKNSSSEKTVIKSRGKINEKK